MKSEKTDKLALRMEKSSSFKTKRGIENCRYGFVEKLSGNNLAKFQAVKRLSTWELKTYIRLAKI